MTAAHSSSFGSAFQANNLGVDCMDNGDYNGAFFNFRQALDHMRNAEASALRLPESPKQQQQQQQQHAADDADGDCCSIGILPAVAEASSYASSSSSPPHLGMPNPSMFYNRGIQVTVLLGGADMSSSTSTSPPSLSWIDNGNSRDRSVLASVITFNVALSNHLKASELVTKGASRSSIVAFLKRACALYSSCQKLIDNSKRCTTDSSPHGETHPDDTALVRWLSTIVSNNIVLALLDRQETGDNVKRHIYHLARLLRRSASSSSAQRAGVTTNDSQQGQMPVGGATGLSTQYQQKWNHLFTLNLYFMLHAVNPAVAPAA